MIYLVHHADAVEPGADPQRPLSAAGRAHAETLATEAAARGVKPVAIWHSGKLRARQTAEPFLRLCNPLAEFSAIRGLQPSDPPEWIRDRRRPAKCVTLMLVGHMPNLPRVLTLLVRGSEPPVLGFPLHGAIALEPSGELWVERWRFRLHPVAIRRDAEATWARRRSSSLVQRFSSTPDARSKVRASIGERATRSERAGGAARESACRGVRGAKPLG